MSIQNKNLTRFSIPFHINAKYPWRNPSSSISKTYQGSSASNTLNHSFQADYK